MTARATWSPARWSTTWFRPPPTCPLMSPTLLRPRPRLNRQQALPARQDLRVVVLGERPHRFVNRAGPDAVELRRDYGASSPAAGTPASAVLALAAQMAAH